jgi:serine/threonine protein kinase
MTDFAAETVAPELAFRLAGGTLGTVGTRDGDWRINPRSEVLASQAYDVFSLGLSWLELCVTSPSSVPSLVAGSSSRSSSSSSVLLGSTVSTSFARIAQYAEGVTDLGLSRVRDRKVRRLLEKMMAVDPVKRPTMREVGLRVLVL